MAFRIVSIVAVVFLSIVAGAAMYHFEIGAYRFLRDPMIAAEALLFAESRNDDVSFSLSGIKPRSVFDSASPPVIDNYTGVTRQDSSRYFDGFTVYAGKKGDPFINLIDMDGRLLHQWTVPHAEVLAASSFGNLPLRRFNAIPHPFSNGDLLMVLTAKGRTPWGLGLAKVDKDSNLIWFFDKPVHHDTDVGPDGRIYALGHFVDNKPRAGVENLATPFIDDTVIVLSESGELLQEFSLLDAVSGSEFVSILRQADPDSYNGDIFHANSVQYLTADVLHKLPDVPEGSLLISLRNIDTVVIVDPATEKVVWAARGGWRLQHEPDLLANGNMLLFDNMGDLSANATGSQVIEMDPATYERVWVFPGESGEPLYSAVRSSQQRLPNGNTLIVESSNGRVIEVDKNNSVVWEFYIPERTEVNGKVHARVVKARRFSPDFFQATLNNRISP